MSVDTDFAHRVLCSAKKAPATRAVMAMSFPVSIKGVLLEAGRVALLENERSEWELPGGRLQAGEDPTICLAREFAEELGIKVAVKTILDSWVYEVLPGQHVVIVTYGAERVDQAPMRLSREHCRLGSFSIAEIDGLAIPEGYRRSIRAWAAISGTAEPAWLGLARELQAMSQTGLFYSKDKYDTERYERLRVLATTMMAMGAGVATEQIIDLFRQDIGYATPPGRCPGRGISRWARIDGPRTQRRALGAAGRLGRCQPDGRPVRRAGNRGRVGVQCARNQTLRRVGPAPTRPHAATPVPCLQDVFPVRDHRRRAAPEPRNQRNRLLRRRRTARPIPRPGPAGSDPAHVRALAPSGITDRFRLGSSEFNPSPISFSASWKRQCACTSLLLMCVRLTLAGKSQRPCL